MNSLLDPQNEAHDGARMSALEMEEANAYFDALREMEDRRDGLDRVATGAESLNEFAHNAGMDRPEHAFLLHDRDVWVRNPYYTGPEVPHPEYPY